MSPRGTLTALTCHLTKKVNKAEELTYLSTNIVSKGKKYWTQPGMPCTVLSCPLSIAVSINASDSLERNI